MQRFTFVVQVRPGENSTLENLATEERVAVADLAAVGPQIELWLEALNGNSPGGVPVAEQEEER